MAQVVSTSYTSRFERPEAVAAEPPASATATVVTVTRGPLDVTLLLAVLALTAIGLIFVYAGTGVPGALSRSGDDLSYFRSQAQMAVLGVVAMAVVSRIDYRFFQKHAGKLLLVAALLVWLTIAGLGDTAKGAERWLVVFGIRFQPVELLKVGTILYLAASIDRKQGQMRDLRKSFVWHTGVILACVVPLWLQPDLGSTMVIFAMLGVMLFVGGAKWEVMAVGVALLGVFFVSMVQMAEYRMRRILAWLDPWADHSESGYQLVASLVALARGGIDGTGLGQGLGRLGYVPEVHTDFIAALIGEEWGIIGLVVVMVLYVTILWRGLVIAERAPDNFGRLLAFGLTVLIVMQAAINLGVVTGMLPTKGLTLPFVSYGRSSLAVMLATVGLLLNIGERNPDVRAARLRLKEAEREREKQEALHRSVRERRSAQTARVVRRDG